MLTLKLAWRNLWRHKRRTWLTAMAMIFSNMLMVFFISLQLSQYDMMIDNTLKMFTGHLQVQQTDYLDTPRIDRAVDNIQSLAAKLREETGYAVAARAETFALASSEQRTFGIRVSGVQPEFEPQVSTLTGLLAGGRYIDRSDAAEIVIGHTLAKNLRVSIGDELTLLGSGMDGSFAAGIVTVVGLFASEMSDVDRSMAVLGLDYFQSIFAMRGAGHSIVLALNSIDAVPAAQSATAGVLSMQGTDANRQTDLVIHDWRALNPGLEQAIQADFVSAWFMYGVLILLVALGVMNTLLMSVLERTREFGVLLALGVKPRILAILVVIESFLMALLSLLIGVLLGALLVWYFQINGLYFPGMDEMAQRFNLPSRIHPQVTLLSLLMGPVLVLVFSMLVACYPALRIFRLRPVEAMMAV